MKKNKHDHKGTKILKLGIFSTLMLAPFMAVLFKCCYVTFNKNAYQSYSGDNSESTQLQQIDVDDYVIDNDYIILNEELLVNTPTSNGTLVIDAEDVSINNIDYPSATLLRFYVSNSMFYVQIRDANNTSLNTYSFNTSLFTINFTYLSRNNDNYTTFLNDYSFYKIKSTNSYLDNAFYYAIDEAMESPYFAWARTSALYTATSGLTTGMGITTQAVPTLIVYWLVLTLIYIVIDIVIELFTFLTHNFMQRTE